MKKSKFEEDFCLLPWTSLEVGISGQYRPCCKYLIPYGQEENTQISAQELNFEDAWNSQHVLKLRQDFLDGKKSVNCERCWSEERAGMTSIRQAEFNNHLLKDIRSPEKLAKIQSPIILDLKMTNTCNLKCRICDPYHSSLWMSEYQDDPRMPRELHFKKFESYMNEANWKTLRKWLPSLQRLMIFGGEPLYQKDFFGLLDLCIELDAAKSISLLINTNTTIFDQRFIDRFKEFKFIEINHSIDDIGARFEYQRHPAKWNDTLINLQKYNQAQTPNCNLMLYCTVSLFNVYYLPEYFDWATKNFPNHKVILNPLHHPAHFSIYNLPAKAKSEIITRLKGLESHRDQLLFPNSIQALIEFLGRKPDGPLVNSFKEIDRADQFRGELYAETFPEMYELITKFQ